MYLPQDPFMLLSFVNMKLRDNYSSLQDFCEDYDVAEEDLKNKLNAIGFTYDETTGQFK